MRPILFVLLATLVLMAAARAAMGDAKKAGLATSCVLLVLFSYGHIFTRLGGLSVAGIVIGRPSVFLLLCLALLVLVGSALWRSQRDFTDLTLVLNWTAIILLIVPIARIGILESSRKPLPPQSRALPKTSVVDSADASGAVLPDIYYIILDRYAAASTLKSEYNFDNSPFLGFLEKKGFYVANESRANYRSTYLSLASSLNMEHLGPRVKGLSPDSTDKTVVYEMVKDYRLWRVLKARGYKFVNLGSGWEPTSRNRNADINLVYRYALGGLDSFSVQLLRTTALYPPIAGALRIPEITAREQTLYQFDQLKALPDVAGPKFVFAHMLIPHDPYVFAPSGRRLSDAEIRNQGEKEKYLGQLLFANREFEKVVGRLLAGKNPPIIVLQSDEGPHPLTSSGDANLYWRRLNARALRTHMRILNALYVPARARRLLYRSITPVNSFRLILDACFGDKYPLLPDRSYVGSDRFHPHRFRDVTSKVDYRDDRPKAKDSVRSAH